jgi:hypothetical protein
MGCIRELDLDGSLAPQADLFPRHEVEWIAARDWGSRLRLACTFGTFGGFRRWLANSLRGECPAVTFYGSGDFHHVTLGLLERIRGPFHLLVLDKHPDWMRGVPFLHCGTWLRHALRLPNLVQVFHCGGDADFDNAYRWLAPWSELRSGRVVIFPALRRFERGGWASLPVRPLATGLVPPTEVLHNALRPFREELARYPLYVSIDKDVLTAEDAAVNWDSGHLRLTDALMVLGVFLEMAGGRLAGADVLGDWSPVRLGSRLGRLCHRLDHPSPSHEPADAARRNRAANAALLAAFAQGTAEV